MFSYKLPDTFVSQYNDKKVPWGYVDAGGNSVGELVFLRTYSRLKEDGSKETWQDVCRRVVEGTISLLKNHVVKNRLPWDENHGHEIAEEMFDRMFHFKWTPPGRGLWMMGTPMVMSGNSAALQNCAFVSTADLRRERTRPFTFLMEASMLGVGVGFDTKGADTVMVMPYGGAEAYNYLIPDTREGWVDSVKRLLDYYLNSGDRPYFHYHLIRPAGTPIKTFGGTAAGPEPLIELHRKITEILDKRIGKKLTSRDILDLMNLIGVCVVSGNVRRSAELAIGDMYDESFLAAKDFSNDTHQGTADDRAAWGWMSNNSVFVNSKEPITPEVVKGIQLNGEPGLIWLDRSRAYGRLSDPPNWKDRRAAGYNPCAEQTLESGEMCTLVETYLGRHEDLEDYKRTLKFAFLYAKTVTLVPTHWEETNAIMQRNRRIGLSMSGVADFVDRFKGGGHRILEKWMDEGYRTVKEWDAEYSEWLGVRESIKVTTVKPSGTVSILAGSSPGVHWTPGGKFFNRLIRFSKDDPLVEKFREAGYSVEPAIENPTTTVVVYFPIASESRRSEREVSIYEKVDIAATAQSYWSDNSVSVTVSFDPETEREEIPTVLNMYQDSLKTLSFLPMGGAYKQMPYEQIDHRDYAASETALDEVDLSTIYGGNALEAVGEMYCTTDACEVRIVEDAQK